MRRKKLDGLAFYTTKDIIEELVNRTTFVGLVIASADEQKRHGQQHNDFTTFSSLGDKEKIIELLKKVINDLQNIH